MSNVNKRFEKWWETERLSTAFDSFREVAREAFQAGHASVREELLGLLESLRDYCVRTCNTQTKAIAKGEESLDWNKGYRSGVSAVLKMIKLAIEEARGK